MRRSGTFRSPGGTTSGPAWRAVSVEVTLVPLPERVVEPEDFMWSLSRRWVGYALLAAGLSLLFDTFTFLLTNWSPLKVPMYTANELALGCLLTVAGVLVLLARTLKRTLMRIRIGVALILVAASIYGGWEWWMATRTDVPLRDWHNGICERNCRKHYRETRRANSVVDFAGTNCRGIAVGSRNCN